MIRLSPEQRALASRHVQRAQNIARSLTVIYGMLHYYGVLRSVALEALSKAAHAYDPSLGVPFEGFAWYRIQGEVRNAIGKEAQRLSFEAVLDAAARIEDESGASIDTDDAIIAQVDDLTADLMTAFYLSCAGQERRAHGDAGLLQREAYADLDGALSQLAPEDRRLVELRYWDDLPWKDVAERLDLPERTAKDHDQKIRCALRAVLSGSPPRHDVRDHRREEGPVTIASLEVGAERGGPDVRHDASRHEVGELAVEVPRGAKGAEARPVLLVRDRRGASSSPRTNVRGVPGG